MEAKKPKFGDKMKVLINEPNGANVKKNEIVIFSHFDKLTKSYLIMGKKSDFKWFVEPIYLKFIE